MVSQSTARMIGNIATLAFVVVIVLQLLWHLVLPVTMAWEKSNSSHDIVTVCPCTCGSPPRWLCL